MPLADCDRAIIESALGVPAQRLIGLGDAYADMPSKAAALTYALAKSQACIDGNKRIALLLLAEFLSLNGAELKAENKETAEMIRRTAERDPAGRDRAVLELALWFEERIVPCEDVA